MPFWFWIIMLAFCVAMEAVTVSLVAIWFIPAALIAMIVSFFPNVPMYVQWLVFVLVGLVLVLSTRPLCRRFLAKRKPRTNADSAVGQKCLVTEEVNNIKETGEVKLNGLKWSARTEENDRIIPVGTEVEVVAINGVKLIVK